MKSMTGFGFCEAENETMHTVLDLKSYNHRYLDIQVNLPIFLNPLEPKIREYLNSRIHRGRVEVALKFVDLNEDLDIQVDQKAVRTYKDALTDIANLMSKDERPHLSHLLRFDGILKVKKIRNLDRIWDFLLPLLDKAFEQFDAARLNEGGSILEDIDRYVAALEKEIEFIQNKQPEIKEDIKNKIITRFEEVMGDKADLDRVYAETAMLLVKYDINEEVSRVNSHLSRFKTVLSQPDSIGKTLDFLAQELNREINTIASKNISIHIGNSVINFKDDLEKIREQLRNVE